jgi:DUF4097 and DUF4098 domain-containing protein YvlB
MRFNKIIILSIIIAVAIWPIYVSADPDREITKKFDNKERIEIKTLSASCILKKGNSDGILLEAVSDYHPQDAVELKIKDRSKVLYLTEKVYGHVDGSAVWTLTVPDGIEIDFKSTSGGLDISDLQGDFSANSASGGYELQNCRGRFDLNTASGSYNVANCEGNFDIHSASGNLYIDNSKGKFDASSASGNVRARNVAITDRSNFGSASGNAAVELGETPEFDLIVGSASGDARLDCAGHQLKGHFEISARRRGGRIKASVDFDETGEFTKNDQVYTWKSFTRGDSYPKTKVGTSTGTAEYRE